jgi:uncharacterized damage-inducible protein DinB
MQSHAISTELLQGLAHHQIWADTLHWKALHDNTALFADAEIQKRLSHMVTALRMLTALARGETPDPSGMKEVLPPDQLEAAQGKANVTLIEAIGAIDPQRAIALPRGPQGPWEAPAGALLLQAITHSQHHRAQNASRMRQLGVTPPMTDFILWYALGQP